MAVRITPTPINPKTHRKNPEMKKARIINIIPMINRKIPSPLLTFFNFMIDLPPLNSMTVNKNPHFLFRSGVLNLSPDHLPTQSLRG
jgi:hypothetical protein